MMNKQRGFTLMELMVVLAIMAAAAAAGVQYVQAKTVELRLQRTAETVRSIEEAGLQYYRATGGWPANLAALTAGNYLPSPFPTSPFGTAYSVSVISGRMAVSVSADTAANANVIASFLPLPTVSGVTVQSEVVVPGSEAAHDALLDLAGTRVMTGNLQMGGNDITNARNIDTNGGYVQTSRVYDDENTGYYVDPASISNMNRVDANDMRANVFYDRDNTAYYVNPASTTNINALTTTGHISGGGNVVTTGYMRGDRFYDGDNTAYYVDPNGTSRVATVDADRVYLRGRGVNAETGIYYANVVAPGTVIPKPTCPASNPTPRPYVTPTGVVGGTGAASLVAHQAYANDNGASWTVHLRVHTSDGQVYDNNGFTANNAGVRLLVMAKCE